MSKIASELCVLLVKEFYGAFHSRIFSILSRHGRLSTPQIAQRAHLTLRSVRGSVAVLLHANLVSHVLSEDGSNWYEANRAQAYNLVRVGRILDIVERKCGHSAASLMMHIICNNDLDSDVLRELPVARDRSHGIGSTEGGRPSDSATNGNMANGYARALPNGPAATDSINEEYTTTGQRTNSVMQDALFRLAEKRLIFQVKSSNVGTEQVMYPKPRKRVFVELDRVLQLGVPSMPRVEVEPYEESQEHQDRAMQDDRKTNGLKTGLKRKASEVDDPPNKPPTKRSKAIAIDSGSNHQTLHGKRPSYGNQGNNPLAPMLINPSKERTFLQANWEKLAMLLRDDDLRVLAQRSLPKETSDVFAAILSQTEKDRYQEAQIDVEALVADFLSQTKSVRGFHDHAAADDSMVNGDSHTRPNDRTASGRRHKSGIDFPYSNSAGNSESLANGSSTGLVPHKRVNGNDRNHVADLHGEQDMTEQIMHHLEILAESRYNFVEKQDTGYSIQWIVPLESLEKTLREEGILSLIKTRFGDLAARLVELLRGLGKTDERFLQEQIYISTKDVRQILGQLKTAGLLELQEVAREASRNPSRTMYFWFFSEERARQLVLEQSLKGMSRCLQRCQIERSKVEPILAKAARSDVRGKEDLYLERHGLRRFRRWKQKEGQFFGELARLDILVSALTEHPQLMLDE